MNVQLTLIYSVIGSCVIMPGNTLTLCWPLFYQELYIQTDTDRYFIDRKKVNPDLFVIEIEICTSIYNIVNLLKSYDNIHSMTYINKIMVTGIAIRNTGYILKIRLKGIARVT